MGFGYGIYDDGPLWPFYMDSMFWPSYYSPFAYRYWGAFDPFYFPGSGYVVIQPPGGGDDTPQSSGLGRVVDGRGYTRVTTRTPEPAHMTGGEGGTAGTMSQGGGNSGGVSTGGYSSGGGGGGDRTAVPRPPGR
jgi:hypothetical protein